MALTFDELVRPLTLDEGLDLVFLWKALPAGVQLKDAEAAITSALSSRWSRLSATFTTAHLTQHVRCIIRDMCTLNPTTMQRRQGALAALAMEGSACCACPRPTHCLLCKAPLETIRRNTPAFFYSDTSPPQKGLAYYKHCAACQLDYSLHGYGPSRRASSASSSSSTTGHHTMYARALDSLEWEEVTTQTFIHYNLFKRHCGALMHGHMAFEAATDVENHRHNADNRFRSGQQDAYPVQAHLHGNQGDQRVVQERSQQRALRFSLNRIRFSHGFFQHMARSLTYELVPHLVPLLDLSADIDDVLDELYEPIWVALKEETLCHMRNSSMHVLCGIQGTFDGNCKVYRKHCAQLLKVEDTTVGGTDFRYDGGQTYCANLPEKSSAYCKQHRHVTGASSTNAAVAPASETGAGSSGAIAGTTVSVAGGAYGGMTDDDDDDEGPNAEMNAEDEAFAAELRMDHEVAPAVPAHGTRAALRRMAGQGRKPERILMQRRSASGELLYLVKWSGLSTSQCSYESSSAITDSEVLADWERRRMPGSFYDGITAHSIVAEVPEVDPRTVPERQFATRTAKRPRVDDPVTEVASNMELTAAAAERRQQGTDKKCSPRYTVVMQRRTAGCMYGFCACGWMYPALEMIMNESPSTLHKYLMLLFDGHSMAMRPDSKFIICWDNACNFRPFATNPSRLNQVKDNDLAKEIAECHMVVDHFHFNKNHTGAYCAKHCSPYQPGLEKTLDAANMSIAEQSFRWMNGFKDSMRGMKKERFRFMLLLICYLDHRMRHKA